MTWWTKWNWSRQVLCTPNVRNRDGSPRNVLLCKWATFPNRGPSDTTAVAKPGGLDDNMFEEFVPPTNAENSSDLGESQCHAQVSVNYKSKIDPLEQCFSTFFASRTTLCNKKILGNTKQNFVITQWNKQHSNNLFTFNFSQCDIWACRKSYSFAPKTNYFHERKHIYAHCVKLVIFDRCSMEH